MTERLISILDERLTDVSFRRAEKGTVVGRNLPTGGAAWSAPYGWLALWPVSAPVSIETLRQANESAEDHLYRVFEEAPDPPGTARDAYAVFALPHPAEDAALRDEVRRVRLMARTCRRVVVWWDGKAWCGLEALPCLGLPIAGDDPNAGAWPPGIDGDQKRLIERLMAQSQAGHQVAREDLEALEKGDER